MLVIIVAIILIAADQFSKLWVVQTLKPVKDIPIIDGILHFHYAENTGASFSMLQGARLLFIIVSAVAAIYIVYYVLSRKRKLHTLEIISLALILGGSVGNLIDRVRLGYVIDFIYVKIINFAIFNVADSCVVVGAILLSIYILFIYDKYTEKIKNEESPEKVEEVNEEQITSNWKR